MVLTVKVGFPGCTSGKEPTCLCRRFKRCVGSTPGSVRSPGGGNGNPLQYSCLKNSMEPGRPPSMGSQIIAHD